MVGKDRGKQGIINCIIEERNWCYVEGHNCVSNQIRLDFLFRPPSRTKVFDVSFLWVFCFWLKIKQ